MAAYIREKKLEQPVIVGHSIGGFLSYLFAIAEPSLPSKVIAVDGLPFLPAAMNPGATEDSAKAAAEQMKGNLSALDKESFLASTRRTLATMITDPAKIEVAAGWASKSDIPSVGQAMYEMLSTDLREKVSAIKAPVLLVGAGSFATTPDLQQMVLQTYESQVSKIPSHKVALALKSKHFIMFDDPEFLWKSMDDFLK
ncbi:MAG: alpha/beta hydrolase [Verrucomicrobiae bacterium]|nr:alpha/beta hydrolase [Verrucomicrobiae bacterium]